MKTFLWWLGCVGAALAFPMFANLLMIPIIVIPMWTLHETFGWFGGYQSSSDSPRMHVHPREDRI